MSPHVDTLSWFLANRSLLFLLNAEWLAEKHKYQFDILWFYLIGATISRIPGEHTKHYTIDAVGSTRIWLMKVKKYIVEMTKFLSEE